MVHKQVWSQPHGCFSQTILLTEHKHLAVISRFDVLVIFVGSQEGFAMSFVLLHHDTQLTGADHFARGRQLRVGSINFHVSQSMIDLKSFEVQGIRHVGVVGHPHYSEGRCAGNQSGWCGDHKFE